MNELCRSCSMKGFSLYCFGLRGVYKQRHILRVLQFRWEVKPFK